MAIIPHDSPDVIGGGQLCHGLKLDPYCLLYNKNEAQRIYFLALGLYDLFDIFSRDYWERLR